jgi:hypothetical protein
MLSPGESPRGIVAALIAIISACGRVTGNEEATDASAEAQTVADAGTPDSTGNGDSSSGVSTPDALVEDGSATEGARSSDGDSSASPPDADAAKSDSKDGGVDSDASGSCDLNTPFGDPQPVAELNTESDEGYARLSPDGLTVYFVRRVVDAGSPGYRRLYAVRPDTNSIFGEALPIPGSAFDSAYMEEAAFTVTADGLNLYFAVGPGPAGCYGGGFWVQSRPTTDAAFEMPRPVPILTTPMEAYALPANTALWFTFVTCSNFYGVQRASLVDGGVVTLDLPVRVGSLAPTPDERFVAYAGFLDGRSYLAEHVDGGYVPRTLNELGSVNPRLNELGSVNPSYLSPDACTMLFHARNRDGGRGGLDIYMTKRRPQAKAPAPGD